MKLTEYKFSDKRDFIVFKSLVRAIKEEIFTTRKQSRFFVKRDLKRLIKICYDSRINHPGEKFETNICYWSEDCGGLFSCSMTKLLYLSLLICELSPKPGSALFKHYITVYDNILKSSRGGFVNYCKSTVCSYHQLFLDAFVKCGFSESTAKNKLEELYILYDAAEFNIPF